MLYVIKVSCIRSFEPYLRGIHVVLYIYTHGIHVVLYIYIHAVLHALKDREITNIKPRQKLSDTHYFMYHSNCERSALMRVWDRASPHSTYHWHTTDFGLPSLLFLVKQHWNSIIDIHFQRKWNSLSQNEWRQFFYHSVFLIACTTVTSLHKSKELSLIMIKLKVIN